MANQTVSVVVPLYREGDNLPELIRQIADAFADPDIGWELILVDDGSPDHTWEAVRTAAGEDRRVRGVRLSRNFGKEQALCAGLERASGDAVVVLDGDLQHPPALITQMVRLWREEGVDIVEAVKEDRGDETLKTLVGARLFYLILHTLAGYDLKNSSDFKLLDRRVVEAWLSMGERNLFFRGMVAWLGFRRRSVSFSVPDRYAGSSKWSIFRLIRLALTAVTSFSSASLHIITAVGGLFLGFAILLGAQTLINKLSGSAVSGFTTVILLQLFIGSLLMISLGIIGEYIARIFEEVKNRPRYLVRDETD